MKSEISRGIIPSMQSTSTETIFVMSWQTRKAYILTPSLWEDIHIYYNKWTVKHPKFGLKVSFPEYFNHDALGVSTVHKMEEALQQNCLHSFFSVCQPINLLLWNCW